MSFRDEINISQLCKVLLRNDVPITFMRRTSNNLCVISSTDIIFNFSFPQMIKLTLEKLLSLLPS